MTFFVAAVEGTGPTRARAVPPAAGRVVWSLLCVGALARLGWLCAGAMRLRQLRQRSRTVVMSRKRRVWTAVVLVCVMAGAIARIVTALPLWPIGEATAHWQQVVDATDPGVTPPKLISEVKPRYTPEAIQARIEGTLMVTAVVHTDGTPGTIEITKSLDTAYGLDKEAVAALSQWRFDPGLKDGTLVPMRITVEMRFWLKE